MTTDTERQRRWRLVLGGEANESCGGLTGEDIDIDQALAALYEPEGSGSLKKQRGGTEKSAPRVARWLGDIRKYFPSSVVQVMQKDALDRLGMREMLLQPEMLEAVQPDVHLVADLISLSGIIPAKTKETARMVVRKVVEELMRKLAEPMRSAVTGALNRAVRNRRPRLAEIDWNRTIRANLRHYQEDYQTVVPETLIGFGRKSQKTQRNIILCIDQSGSMAASVVYSSIFGAVMASLPAVKTQLVVFDTAVVDLTEKLDDPVECSLAPSSAAARTSTKPSATAKASSPTPRTRSSCSSPTSSKAASRKTSSNAPTSSCKAVCSSSPCSPSATKALRATIKN